MGSVEYWQARAQEADARIAGLEAERDHYEQECDRVRDRLLALAARIDGAEATALRTFPVMLDCFDRKKLSTVAFPTSVPWGFIEQYERAAKRIHDQTLERLAQRGGLSPREIMAVITNNRAWWEEPEEKAVKALKDAVAEYRMEASVYAGVKAP